MRVPRPADDHPDDGERGVVEVEDVRSDPADAVAEEDARESRDPRPDGEDPELVEPHVVAEELRPELVLADGDADPPEVGAGEPAREEVRDDERPHRDVEHVLGEQDERGVPREG